MRRKRNAILFLAAALFWLLFFSVPVRAEGEIRIAANKKYKGMNASFAKGYEPSVKKNKLRLVVPFLADASVKGDRLQVGVSFDREENSPFYFQTYEKRVKKSADGVYLYRCNVKLKKERVNGQYPLRLNARAQTADGILQQEFVIYVEITDGIEAQNMGDFGERQEEAEALQEPGGQAEEEATEEIIRQPRIILSENSLQGMTLEAGDGSAWKLLAKNCSNSQTMENVKVTLLSESVDLCFEKNSWYFERVGAGAVMDLSQDMSVEKKALEAFVPVEFQFDYEDKKGNAYHAQETVRLQVRQSQQARLVNFSMPEGIYESDTESLTFQAQNTGLAVLYNARVRLEGQGLFANEVFLGNIEAGSSADGEMQVFAGTLDMDAEGNISDENEEKYGEAKGRVIFSYENERGEVTEQEQEFSTAILKPKVLELTIEEEEEPQTNQWQTAVIVMVFLVMLLVIICLYLRMRYYAARVKKEARSL